MRKKAFKTWIDRENRPCTFGECRGGVLIRFGSVRLLPGI